jgi:ribonuclease-3
MSRLQGELEPSRIRDLQEFCERNNIRFKDLHLLDQSLTHSSFAKEPGRSQKDNQRLEYLGDSVLGFIVNEFLYRSYPDYQEGALARIKSAAVSEKTLSGAARAIRLGSILRMSRGERNSGGARRPSNLADGFEALIAGIYLDRGISATRKFVLNLLQKKIESLSKPGKALDPKSALQEMIQKRSHTVPVYELVGQGGPDHKREFTCRVLVQGLEIARGQGSSRKRAEQQAAQRALEKLRDP